MKYVSVTIICLYTLFGNALTVDGSTTAVPYYIKVAAKEFNLDVALLYAICTKESKCRINAINLDDARKALKLQGKKEASTGLFQIKLNTAKMLGFKGTVKDLMKPKVNTWYAAKYLRHLYNRYGSTTKAISAYNAGRFINANKKYVDDVLKNYAYYKLDRGL